MADFAKDLCNAMMAEIKCAARKKGITAQQEFEHRCNLALLGEDERAWGDAVGKATIGIVNDVTRTASSSDALGASSAGFEAEPGAEPGETGEFGA